MTAQPFPYPPIDTLNGQWSVTLGPGARIGEVKAWARYLSPLDPWEQPFAPPGTTATLASTHIVPQTWIDAYPSSFELPVGESYRMVVIGRASTTPPNAELWFEFGIQYNNGYLARRTNVNGATMTYYGPGATFEGQIIPADAFVCDCSVQNIGGNARLHPTDQIVLLNASLVQAGLNLSTTTTQKTAIYAVGTTFDYVYPDRIPQ